MMRPIIVIGAGGHAAVVADALLAAGEHVLGYTDSDPARHGHMVCGLPVLGSDDVLQRHSPGAVYLVNGIGGAGRSNTLGARGRAQSGLEARGWHFIGVLHPSAVVSPFAVVAGCAQLLARCVVQPGAVVGEGCIVNTAAVVEHHCRLAAHVHVACGAVLCGNVVVGANSHVGAGATLKEGVILGERTVVGAGAVVLDSFPADSTLVGVPARDKRKQTVKNWEQALIAPTLSLREALAVIDQVGSQMALVVDPQRRLLGTLSDGDVRRALLRGMRLSDPVASAMFLTPTVAQVTDDKLAISARMRDLQLHQMPIVTAERTVVGMAVVDDFLRGPARDNWVVVMAGGLGSRLQHLTRDTPKPMLRVGSRPLLETILRGFSDQGFRNFYFAVNYKAEQIEQHFGDGREFGVQIRYLREDQRLGTAGALSLLPEAPPQPIVVTNADLLTRVDCGAMLDEHAESGADATMAVREYEMQVPFGVVRESEGRIGTIDEKPKQYFTVSAGIYVLSPRVLELVPGDTYIDMPALFTAAIERQLHARCHHIDGYWLDIGRLSDYERANLEYAEVFR